MFKLTIKCTKDIEELHINFSDGTSMTKMQGENKSKASPQSKKRSEKRSEEPRKTRRPGGFIDADAEYGSISQEVIKKPEIPGTSTEIKVAEELQNLDI